MYELSVRKRIDHFNGREWFVVQELECGEELIDVNTQIEAVYGMLELILEKPSKYMTKQNVKDLLTEASANSAWSRKYPTESGFYLWREIGNSSPHSVLAVVSVNDKGVFVKFEQSLSEPEPMGEQAEREWMKVPG